MIPYGRHSISDEDISAVVAALKSDWLTTGPLVEQFESAIEKVVQAPAVSVSSGTAALHCAYVAIGIEPGDEIITPPITFVATQATASLLGAKIVFADVQEDTANIDPLAVESAITSRTKAIVAVDYAGHPADMDELRVIADRHGLYLIEDAAHSFGSTYKQRPVGSIADITTFSFYPTKNLTTGEGGAVSSTNIDLLDRAKKFSRQGLVRDPMSFYLESDGPWHQEVQEFGLNYRLPDILCALGISQLSRIKKFKKKRNEIFDRYCKLLGANQFIRLPSARSYVDPNWHLFSVRVPKQQRLDIFNFLRSAGIGVQVNYMPAYRHPVFANHDFSVTSMTVSDEFYNSEISLPMHVNLKSNEIEYISEKLVAAINRFC